MTTVEKDQLVCFMYLLTRGTQNCPGLPWGHVKELVRECGAPPRDNVFTSKAGEAIAVELANELLTGEQPDLEAVAHELLDIDTQVTPPGLPLRARSPGRPRESIGSSCRACGNVRQSCGCPDFLP